MNIFSKLNKITNLTENEKTLVKYIENNSEDFIKMSAVKIRPLFRPLLFIDYAKN